MILSFIWLIKPLLLVVRDADAARLLTVSAFNDEMVSGYHIVDDIGMKLLLFISPTEEDSFSDDGARTIQARVGQRLSMPIHQICPSWSLLRKSVSITSAPACDRKFEISFSISWTSLVGWPVVL